MYGKEELLKEVGTSSLNLSYIPPNIKTVVIINDFDYIEGGAANVAISTAKALVKAGYNTYFFSAVSKKNTPKINGVKYISTNQYASLSDPNKMRGALNGLYNFKAARSLKKLLKNLDNKTTLIHIHTWTKALSSSIWNAAYSLHVPIYLTCHDYFTVCPNGGFFNYKKTRICKKKPLSISCLKCNCDSRNYGIKLYRFARGIVQNKLVNILKKTSKFISISSFSENILKENFPKNIIFERVYNPIDAIDFAEKIHPESNKYFLFVGRLSKEKGCELFCQAITDLKQKGIVVGDGPDASRLRSMFTNDYVSFVGWKNRNEVFEYMHRAKALIFPSMWYETDGLSVREALSIGLPCIVSDCCAAKDYITDSTKGCTFNSLENLKQAITEYNGSSLHYEN